MGAELSKLTREMFPFNRGGSSKEGRPITGSAGQCLHSNSITLKLLRGFSVRPSGSVLHSDLVTDDLFNPRGRVVEDSADLLYLTLAGSSKKAY